MRVLILAQHFPNKNKPEQCSFIKEDALNLSKYIDVVVVNPLYRFPPLPKYRELINETLDIPEIERIENLTILRPRTIYCLGATRVFNINMFIRSVKNLKKEIGKIDLVHAYFAHIAGFAGISISKFFKVPLVVGVMGSDINRFVLRNEGRWYDKKRALASLSVADAIIAVSKDLTDKVNQLGNFSAKTHQIYNGVSTDTFKPADKLTTRKELGLPTGKKILLFVGNIIKEKGVLELLDAIKIINRDDLIVVMVGRDYLQSAEIQNHPQILCKGAVPYKNIPRYMQASDILVHPSYSEGFGKVLIESLACGCPVVSTDTTAIPEIISSEDFGILVPPKDSVSLADAISNALARKWNTDKLVGHAKRFSTKKSIQKILSLYKTL